MKKAVLTLLLTSLPLFYVTDTAAEQVVVVPLPSSSAKGTDGQLQYNKNGKTAGAELYYDTSSRRLEARGEIRTTDSTGNPRLWGRGRPGTGLITHTPASGTCGNILTTRYALSTQLVTWETAAEACPAGTWVCTRDELPVGGSCNVPNAFYYYEVPCSGPPAASGTIDVLTGWLADSYSPVSGETLRTDNFLIPGGKYSCSRQPVWCCWKSAIVIPPLP